MSFDSLGGIRFGHPFEESRNGIGAHVADGGPSGRFATDHDYGVRVEVAGPVSESAPLVGWLTLVSGCGNAGKADDCEQRGQAP